MKRVVSRLAYCLILRLHPASFRDEFGPEMLWIFDHFDHQQPGQTAHLFFDVTTSLLRQRCRSHNNPGQLSIASGVIITGPGIGAARFLQAAIALLLIGFSLMSLKQPNRLNASVIWSDRMPCYTVTLQAPSHAEVVLGTAP
jgi:hypothetical protein